MLVVPHKEDLHTIFLMVNEIQLSLGDLGWIEGKSLEQNREHGTAKGVDVCVVNQVLRLLFDFWCLILRGADNAALFCANLVRMAKINECHLILIEEHHIVRFDVAVSEISSCMHFVESFTNLAT